MKLPEEYTPLIQSIGSQGEITTELVKERLLSEAARQASLKQESALASAYADRQYRGRGRGQGRGRGRGQSTFAKDPWSSHGSPRFFEGHCHGCGKYGHRRQDCRSTEHGKVCIESGKQATSEAAKPSPEAEKVDFYAHYERVLVSVQNRRLTCPHLTGSSTRVQVFI